MYYIKIYHQYILYNYYALHARVHCISYCINYIVYDKNYMASIIIEVLQVL